MAVRNFYVDADIDGRPTMLGGGPRAKDGGMTVFIYQRDNGSISDPIKIHCSERNGKLLTEVFNQDGVCVYRYETER